MACTLRSRTVERGIVTGSTIHCGDCDQLTRILKTVIFRTVRDCPHVPWHDASVVRHLGPTAVTVGGFVTLGTLTVAGWRLIDRL